MTKWSGINENGEEIKTCKAALGVSFCSGCSDGHGAKFFIQGTNQDYLNEHLGGNDWIWLKIRDAIGQPIIKCVCI